MRVCWNWHTSGSQKPWPKGLRVQLPSPAPIQALTAMISYLDIIVLLIQIFEEYEPSILGECAQLARAAVCKTVTTETPLVQIQPLPPRVSLWKPITIIRSLRRGADHSSWVWSINLSGGKPSLENQWFGQYPNGDRHLGAPPK